MWLMNDWDIFSVVPGKKVEMVNATWKIVVAAECKINPLWFTATDGYMAKARQGKTWARQSRKAGKLDRSIWED